MFIMFPFYEGAEFIGQWSMVCKIQPTQQKVHEFNSGQNVRFEIAKANKISKNFHDLLTVFGYFC